MNVGERGGAWMGTRHEGDRKMACMNRQGAQTHACECVVNGDPVVVVFASSRSCVMRAGRGVQ